MFTYYHCQYAGDWRCGICPYFVPLETATPPLNVYEVKEKLRSLKKKLLKNTLQNWAVAQWLWMLHCDPVKTAGVQGSSLNQG